MHNLMDLCRSHFLLIILIAKVAISINSYWPRIYSNYCQWNYESNMITALTVLKFFQKITSAMQCYDACYQAKSSSKKERKMYYLWKI